MSLLTLIQNVADEIGLPRPSLVAASNDRQVQQLYRLATREGKSLAKIDWEVLTKEETHTTIAAEDQGALTDIVSADFDRIVEGSMWNRSEIQPIYGAISKQRWQRHKSSTVTGPATEFRIRGGNLLLIPAPSAGDTLAFEWISSFWCQSAASAGQTAWAADDDTAILDQDLMELGVIWRFKEAKGLDWEAAKIEYINAVNELFTQDEPSPELNMGGNRTPIRGLAIQEGSWPL